MNSIIHKALRAWLSWRRQKALYRAAPQLRELRGAAKRDAMTSLLAGKDGRAN